MYRTSGSWLFYFSCLIMKVPRNFEKSSNMQSQMSKATFNSNSQYITRVLDTWSWSSLADIQVMFFIGLERDQFHVWLIMRRRLSRRLSPPPHKEITALIIKVSEKLHLVQTRSFRPKLRWGSDHTMRCFQWVGVKPTAYWKIDSFCSLLRLLSRAPYHPV